VGKKFSRRRSRSLGGGDPEKLSDVIARVITERGYARQLSTSAFQEAWQAVTDPVLAAASRPGHLRCGVLEITVKNSIVMQELTFRKQQIIRRLADRMPTQKIGDLRFRIGAVD